MEVRAYLKSARLSPQKACLVADMVRGLDVEKALDVLSFSKQKGAVLIKKLLDSAISNAENNENADIDDLKIKSISSDDRFMFCGSMGLNNDLKKIMIENNFHEGANNYPGEFVLEKAFVD